MNYASLSLATSRNVTSTLTGCTISDNFYGGGKLGKVDGNVTSTLTDCTVTGSVFGAGYSALAPTVNVFTREGFTVEPLYDGNSGTYTEGEFPTYTTYTWKHAASVSAGNEFEDDDDNHFILTTEDMTTLGTVTGAVTLTIKGNSTVGGNVFGGGNESPSNANTSVILRGNTQITGNVFGGGNKAAVGGTSSVTIQDEP